MFFKLSKLFYLLLLLQVLISSTEAQGKYGDLKNWRGKFPRPEYNRIAENKWKGNFFELPEINSSLKKLLTQTDFQYLTKRHTKEAPIEIKGDYLKLTVCGSHKGIGCDNNTVFVMNLVDGSIYVAVDRYAVSPKFYSTKGKFTDLPKNLQY